MGRIFDLTQSFQRNRLRKIVLNRRASRSFHDNTQLTQGSILGPMIFIKDLSDAISSQLGILCPNIYSYLRCKLNRSDNVNLELFEKDLQSMFNWSTKWFGNFNAFNPSLLSINHYREQMSAKGFRH